MFKFYCLLVYHIMPHNIPSLLQKSPFTNYKLGWPYGFFTLKKTKKTGGVKRHKGNVPGATGHPAMFVFSTSSAHLTIEV